MKIFLAPMEGVIDNHMRDTLTGVGGYDHCVTEFVRVVDRLLPGKVFRRLCPELNHDGKTAAGTPVTIQLLGGIPEVMAENAERAVQLGAPGIDINFGCPSKFVNRKAGGAVLLKEPQRVFAITNAVRKAVPHSIPVSAKIRLGYETTDLALDIAQAVETAGADFVTVHARTKADGYKHPARWEWLANLKEALNIPLVANGDINSVDDFIRCRDISNCDAIMLGRGAVIRPDLALQIRASQHSSGITSLAWHDIQALLIQMSHAMKKQEHIRGRYVIGRIKQWLAMLKRHYPEAAVLFNKIRSINHWDDFEPLLVSGN